MDSDAINGSKVIGGRETENAARSAVTETPKQFAITRRWTGSLWVQEIKRDGSRFICPSAPFRPHCSGEDRGSRASSLIPLLNLRPIASKLSARGPRFVVSALPPPPSRSPPQKSTSGPRFLSRLMASRAQFSHGKPAAVTPAMRNRITRIEGTLVSLRILFRAGRQCQLAGSAWLSPVSIYFEDKELCCASLVRHRMRVQMRTMPTPEESARSILAVFKASGDRANEVLMLGAVDRRFLSRRDARPVDFTSGLRHAVDVGWVELAGQGRQLRLTQAGYDAMSAQEPAHRAASRR